MRARCSVWGAPLCVALVGVTLCWSSGCTDDNRRESRIDNKDLGKDPHRFKTAEIMYHAGPTMVRDTKMDGLLQQFTGQLEAKADPISPEMRELLVALDPYRKCEEVQSQIPKWAGRCATWVGARAPVTGVDAKRADESYRKGDFAQAVDEYAKVLQQAPQFRDARNNLALAEIHQGHDLAAQLQLEILRQWKSDYLPALVNLTVVYERLGQSAKAKALAAEAAKNRTDVPAATFNVAWYQISDGEAQKAEQTLRPLADLQVDPQHAELYKLTQKVGATAGTAADQPGFWRQGIAGVCGGKTGAGARTVAIVLFLVSAGFACAFAGSIGKANRSSRGSSAGWSFVFLGSFWYLLFWGVPSGGWWLLAGGYVVLGTSMSVAAAKS